MIFDDTDKATAAAFETAVKDANINGIPGLTDSAMTDAQYGPPGLENVGRDINRDTGAAFAAVLRSVPLRALVCTAATLPAPREGGVIFVRDGAGGSPCLAFSDGAGWLRCDTLGAVG